MKVENRDLISVIVPIYNVEKYINRCIDSITKQTYKYLEIILVDDGSPDNCGKICDEYAKTDNRIIVIHKENGGLSDARNAGINIAKGLYITFIDSDDYIDEKYIEILYQALKEDKSDMSIGGHKAIYENGTIINKATGERSVLVPEQVLERILYDDGIDLSAWAKLYKTNLFKNIRYPKGRIFEDSATTYKLIDNCKKISITSERIYNYMIRNESITNVSFSIKKMELITSTEEMTSYIEKKYPNLEKACNRRLMYSYLSTLSQLAMSKKKFKKEQQEIMKFVNKNRFKVLFDRRAPKRDKIALLSTILGFNCFKIIWEIYRKKSGRK